MSNTHKNTAAKTKKTPTNLKDLHVRGDHAKKIQGGLRSGDGGP